jgi:hypothetical protein
LTSGFLLAREGPDRCLSRLVQNLISRRSLRIHSASCGTPGELEGQRRDRVLTPHKPPSAQRVGPAPAALVDREVGLGVRWDL